jgi:hypothetical protein
MKLYYLVMAIIAMLLLTTADAKKKQKKPAQGSRKQLSLTLYSIRQPKDLDDFHRNP